jgi:C-terminal binding protein
MINVLEPESLYPDTALEQRVMGDGVRISGGCEDVADGTAGRACAEGDALMTLRMAVPKEALDRFQAARRGPYGRGL